VKEPPYIMALICLDGADCGFSHFIGGIDMSDISEISKKINVGTKVKAMWSRNKNDDIYDIAHFEPGQ
jgi:uncharacterized OB-fold protein